MTMQCQQLKVSLPQPLYQLLQAKAEPYGLSLAGYIKHLIINDVKSSVGHTLPLSPVTTSEISDDQKGCDDDCEQT
jgi:hypothetical protein